MTKPQLSAADPPSPDPAEDDDEDAVDILTAIDERYGARVLRPGLTMFVPWNVTMPENPKILADLDLIRGADGRSEVERLADLVAHIHAIASGEIPLGCPALVEHWQVDEPYRDAQPRFLMGVLMRHPTLRTPAPHFRSSLLIAISAEERWALTVSRFYELGTPR